MAGGVTAGSPVVGSPALTENAGTETWPAESDVRLGVTYGPTGSEYTGTMAEGGGSYPTADQIAAAVVAQLNATTIPVNVTHFNGNPTVGSGTPADPVRPA